MHFPPIQRGLTFTLVVLALMEGVERSGRSLTFPGPFWELAVVHAALTEGLVSGLASAVVTILYAAYALSTAGSSFHYSDESAQRLMTQVIAGPTLAIFVAFVRRHRLKD